MLTTLIALLSTASASEPADISNHRLTGGVELFSLFLEGRQLEVGYERGRGRVAVAAASLPGDLWNAQVEDFSVTNDYVELTASWFLTQPDERPGGLHVGLNSTWYYDVAVTSTTTEEELSKSQVRLGGRIGYFYYPFKQYDFFIEPTWNMGLAVNDADMTFEDGGVFQARGVQITGMIINIGGAFDLTR